MCLGASRFSLRLATELVYIGLKEGATSESWSQVQPEKKPKNRLFHTAVYYEGFMWIFGGSTKACADKNCCFWRRVDICLKRIGGRPVASNLLEFV